ncbi:Glycerol-3-phosphate acyltransferase PlsY [[Mycoplasma] cavipharyngis]|uniref:glycerol-3-phosphate 1-O-acyltransferase PlsY n=1 Tax=[Mycoplasma] cavipharyngis TaxID=92757 RepID=UPI003703DEE1
MIVLIMICFILVAIIIGYLFGSISFSLILSKLVKVDILNQGSKNAGATNLARLSKLWLGFLVAFFDMIKVILAGFFFYLFAYYVGRIIFNFNNASINNPNDFVPNIFFSNVFKHNDFPYKIIFIIYLTPVVAVFAHCFPIYSKFRNGGKGVASFLGLSFFISPWLGIALVIIWWTLQFAFKYVSLSSIISVIIIAIIYWINELRSFYWISQNNLIAHGFFLFDYSNSGGSMQERLSVDWVLTTYVFFLIFCSVVLIILRHKANIKRLLNHQEKKFDVLDNRTFKKILNKITSVFNKNPTDV